MRIPLFSRLWRLEKQNERLKGEVSVYKGIVNQFVRELQLRLPNESASTEVKEVQLEERYRVILGLLKTGGSGTPNDLSLLLSRSRNAVSTDLIKLYSWGFLRREKKGRTYTYYLSEKDKQTSTASVEDRRN